MDLLGKHMVTFIMLRTIKSRFSPWSLLLFGAPSVPNTSAFSLYSKTSALDVRKPSLFSILVEVWEEGHKVHQFWISANIISDLICIKKFKCFFEIWLGLWEQKGTYWEFCLDRSNPTCKVENDVVGLDRSLVGCEIHNLLSIK